MLLALWLCAAANAVTPQVAAGGWHTVVLKADGTLWVWGDNDKGKLGLGATSGPQKTPVQMGTANDWVKVACGRESTFAIKSDGTLWAWGWNGHGQLGVGDMLDRTTPTLVGSAADDWIDVASGYRHTVAVKANGTLWAWGYNNYGQLGQGTFDGLPHFTPLQIGSATVWAKVAASPSEGDHTLALTAASGGINALYAWGSDSFGQLGDWSASPVKADQYAPAAVSLVYLWTSIAAGDYHSAAVRSNGSLYTWGVNSDANHDYGQLGFVGTTDQLTAYPLGGTDWSSVVCTSLSTLALKTDGSLYGAGCNRFGAVGVGSFSEVVQTFTQSSVSGWAQLAGGRHHVVGLKTDGSIWTWGINDWYQLGLNDMTNRNVPTAVGLYAGAADSTAPVTVAATSPAANSKGWNKTKPVTVSLTATDDVSGTAYTEYSIDGGATWTRGASCAVTAEGTTTVQYRSADNAGNVEAVKSTAVSIDTVRPVPKALGNVTVKKGKKAALRFKITDASCTACSVKIVIKNSRNKVVKKLSISACKTNKAVRATFKCKLPKGKYKWYVSATDPAGNTQSKVAWKKLKVK